MLGLPRGRTAEAGGRDDVPGGSGHGHNARVHRYGRTDGRMMTTKIATMMMTLCRYVIPVTLQSSACPKAEPVSNFHQPNSETRGQSRSVASCATITSFRNCLRQFCVKFRV